MFLALSLLAGSALDPQEAYGPEDPGPGPEPGPDLEPQARFDDHLQPRLPARHASGRQGVLPGKRVLERKQQWVNVDKTLAFHCPSCGVAPGTWCNRRTLGRRPFHMARIQAAEGAA
jgi:hypothetical protein